jgi:hypothetical protein
MWYTFEKLLEQFRDIKDGEYSDDVERREALLEGMVETLESVLENLSERFD